MGDWHPGRSQASTAARDPHAADAERCSTRDHPCDWRRKDGGSGESEPRRGSIRDDCGRAMADRPRGRRSSVTRIEVVPSILSADVSRLGDQVREAMAAGADRIQVDIMAGHFVPNLTFGPLVVDAVRKVTDLPNAAPLGTHNPAPFIAPYARSVASLTAIQD